MKVPSGVQYNVGFVLGIKAFAAAVLGGIGNIRGALLGGLLLAVGLAFGGKHRHNETQRRTCDERELTHEECSMPNAKCPMLNTRVGH